MQKFVLAEVKFRFVASRLVLICVVYTLEISAIFFCTDAIGQKINVVYEACRARSKR
jgi:hypothetical protein